MRKIIVLATIVAFLITGIGCATYSGRGYRGYRYYHVRSRTGNVNIHEKHTEEIGSNLASVEKLAIYTAGGALVGIGLLYLLTRNHKAKNSEPKPKPEEGKRIMVCGGREFLLKGGQAYEIQNGRISGKGKKYEIVNDYLILEEREVINCN